MSENKDHTNTGQGIDEEHPGRVAQDKDLDLKVGPLAPNHDPFPPPPPKPPQVLGPPLHNPAQPDPGGLGLQPIPGVGVAPVLGKGGVGVTVTLPMPGTVPAPAVPHEPVREGGPGGVEGAGPGAVSPGPEAGPGDDAGEDGEGDADGGGSRRQIGFDHHTVLKAKLRSNRF